VIGGDYTAVEARLSSAIYLRFGLPAEPSASLKRLMKRQIDSLRFTRRQGLRASRERRL
jgi:hypothetical protein